MDSVAVAKLNYSQLVACNRNKETVIFYDLQGFRSVLIFYMIISVIKCRML